MSDPIKVAGKGNMGAERLSNSLGGNEDRLKFVENDEDNRYAIAYQAITDGHDKDSSYELINPFKKRYWVPLKIESENGDPVWVLVNKASLRKRFGLSSEEIEKSISDGKLNELVQETINKIKENPKIDVGNPVKFITAGFPLWNSKGEVKDRVQFMRNDPNNKYAIHYKPIDHQDQAPVLKPWEHRYWVPLQIKNKDGSDTWILLNKSSLKIRFDMNETTLAKCLVEGTLMETIMQKAKEMDEAFEYRDEYNKIYKNMVQPLHDFLSNLNFPDNLGILSSVAGFNALIDERFKGLSEAFQTTKSKIDSLRKESTVGKNVSNAIDKKILGIEEDIENKDWERIQKQLGGLYIRDYNFRV